MLLWGVSFKGLLDYWIMGYGWFVISISWVYIWSLVWFDVVDIVFRSGKIAEDLVIRLQSDVI